jgi:hypothetical protein
MTTGRGGQDPMQAGAQMFEAGYQQLFEGWRQAQEFWSGVARSWGGAAGGWMQGAGAGEESMTVLRELNEAAFAVAQAWMRLPLVLVGGAQPTEIQDATTHLTEAQGRAYQLWLEALSRAGGDAAGTARRAAREMEKESR